MSFLSEAPPITVDFWVDKKIIDLQQKQKEEAGSSQTDSHHNCLIHSFRGRNNTEYLVITVAWTESRFIIVARQIINAAVIYVVSSII